MTYDLLIKYLQLINNNMDAVGWQWIAFSSKLISAVAAKKLIRRIRVVDNLWALQVGCQP